jgi:integrase/recombinase XerD
MFQRDRLPELADHTQRSYRTSLAAFRTYFCRLTGDPELAEIRAQHIRLFLNWRRGHGPDGRAAETSARTVQKERTVCGTLFAYAVDMELIEANPVQRVPAPKVDPAAVVLLKPAELERLLEECEPDPMLWMYALLLAETGLRCESEATWIQWQDIDLGGGFLLVAGRARRTKSGKARWVPLTPRLREALRAHQERFGGDGRPPWVFYHTRVRTAAKPGERVKSFRHAFDAAAVRAKLPEGFTMHALRHLRVTTWLAEGKNVTHVREALGHSVVQTTMGYLHLAREHLRALVDET